MITGIWDGQDFDRDPPGDRKVVVQKPRTCRCLDNKFVSDRYLLCRYRTGRTCSATDEFYQDCLYRVES